MSAFEFSPTIERFAAALRLTLWGKIHLCKYPASAIAHAEQQLARKGSSVRSKIGFLRNALESYCRNHNIEPNHAITEQLGTSTGMPMRAAWTLDEDPRAPTALSSQRPIDPGIAEQIKAMSVPEKTKPRQQWAPPPKPRYSTKEVEQFIDAYQSTIARLKELGPIGKQMLKFGETCVANYVKYHDPSKDVEQNV